MKIPYKVIDGIVYVDARVEIPEHVFNNIPAFDNHGEYGYFLVDHIKPGKATRFFGDVALVFLEPEQKTAPTLESIIYNAPDLGNVDVRYVVGCDPFQKPDQVNSGLAQVSRLTQHDRDQDYLKAIAEQYKKEKSAQQEPTKRDWEEIVEKFRKTPTVFIHGSVTILTKLGFQKRSEFEWFHPLFGADSEENWMHFDPKTDDIQHIIPKMYHYGWNKGRQELRYEVKTALGIPLR
jgi:hypothetical protein